MTRTVEAQTGSLVIGLKLEEEIWIDLGVIKIRFEELKFGYRGSKPTVRVRVTAPLCVKVDRLNHLIDLGVVDEFGQFKENKPV